MTCEQCGKAPDPKPIAITLEMAPGPDGKPGRTCSACWLEGFKTKKGAAA